MKYLPQFLIILGFSLLGEALQRLLPLPIPASVWGIALLFAALSLKLIRPEQVEHAGSFLTSLLPILFVSPMVGILENWGLIRNSLLLILLLTFSTTIIVFGISGRIAQALLGKEEKT